MCACVRVCVCVCVCARARVRVCMYVCFCQMHARQQNEILSKWMRCVFSGQIEEEPPPVFKQYGRGNG